MLRLDCLSAETGRLLDALAEHPEIGAFTLIGGTALALSWGHRLSEDLDFAFPGLDLPRRACSAIVDALEQAGWSAEDITNPLSRLYHENEGADLADTQQDWLFRRNGAATGVKLTFFAEYMPVKQQPYALAPLRHGHVKVMAPEGLFQLKSQVLLHRTTLRDLFDLWTFLEHGQTVEDILAAIQAENRHFPHERLRAALLKPRISEADPGLASLVADGPADLAALTAALSRHVDACEARMAADIFGDDSATDTP